MTVGYDNVAAAIYLRGSIIFMLGAKGQACVNGRRLAVSNSVNEQCLALLAAVLLLIALKLSCSKLQRTASAAYPAGKAGLLTSAIARISHRAHLAPLDQA
jgi:hypothetical protein